MLVSDFDYHLPAELIAQVPLADRCDSRMLHFRRDSGSLRDGRFRDFPQILRPDDLVVFNNTLVFPARLFGRKDGANASPGKVEVLLTRQLSEEPNEWECLVKPGRRIGLGDRLVFDSSDGGNSLGAEVVERGPFGERRLRFDPSDNFFDVLDCIGHVPLPPYISRPDLEDDAERYQTVYARERGSVAAPTAGLHFTHNILDDMKLYGIDSTEITLHVGLGTFQPVRVDLIENHKLHRESYLIPRAAAEKINSARESGRRVIAVGTTTVRTLEHCANLRKDGTVQAGAGEADIFIYPGFRFRIVDGILTNFHLPRSSLLMLISAFGGREPILAAYNHAVALKYRFYSYGDCMFIE